jgi:hypothetical protein
MMTELLNYVKYYFKLPNIDNTFKMLGQTLAEGKVLFFPVCIPTMSHFLLFALTLNGKPCAVVGHFADWQDKN